MKNLPYYKGGTCKIAETKISFSGDLKNLEFNDFEDFCNRADDILETFIRNKNKIPLVSYKKYIYEKKLNVNDKLDYSMKDKCFEWILSNEYDDISKNDLYSLLGMARKEKNK